MAFKLGHEHIARAVRYQAVAVAGDALAYGPLGYRLMACVEALRTLVTVIHHEQRAVLGFGYARRLVELARLVAFVAYRLQLRSTWVYLEHLVAARVGYPEVAVLSKSYVPGEEA